MKYTLVGRCLLTSETIEIEFTNYSECKLEQFVMEDKPEYSSYSFSIQIDEHALNALLSSVTELVQLTH